MDTSGDLPNDIDHIAHRAASGRSDEAKFVLWCNAGKEANLSENPLRARESRDPSKLMTRVRFPSPAPPNLVEPASRMRPCGNGRFPSPPIEPAAPISGMLPETGFSAPRNETMITLYP